MSNLISVSPFGSNTILKTLTGAQLLAALELGLSQLPRPQGGFPQASRFRHFLAATPFVYRGRPHAVSGQLLLPSYSFPPLDAGGRPISRVCRVGRALQACAVCLLIRHGSIPAGLLDRGVEKLHGPDQLVSSGCFPGGIDRPGIHWVQCRPNLDQPSTVALSRVHVQAADSSSGPRLLTLCSLALTRQVPRKWRGSLQHAGGGPVGIGLWPDHGGYHGGLLPGQISSVVLRRWQVSRSDGARPPALPSGSAVIPPAS